MEKKILVCLGVSYGGNLRRISAIVDKPHQWGSGEQDPARFKVISADLSETQISEWSVRNKWCVDIVENKVVATPEINWYFERVITPIP